MQTILAEIGSDLSKFRSSAAFSSLMGLCPNNDISDRKVLRSATRRVNNRVALTLRLAAQSLQQSQPSLCIFYRRLHAKLGAPKTITAAAHKLARIIYHLLTSRQSYDESVFAKADQQQLARARHRLKIQASALGFILTPMPDTQQQIP